MGRFRRPMSKMIWNHIRLSLIICSATLLALNSELVAEENSFEKNFLLQIGLVTLNPFEISGSGTEDQPFAIQTSQLTSRGFVEANANLRWAWGRGKELHHLVKEKIAKEKSLCYGLIWNKDSFCAGHDTSVWKPWIPDFQARLGFTFGTDEDDASTIVGSGDLYAEAVVGWNLFRFFTTDGLALSFNAPEISGSLVTGRESQDIFANYILGGGVAISIFV